MQARLQGMSKAAAQRARRRAGRPASISPVCEGRDLTELSGGQRRRVDVALGLMHSPQLVFLDEPTTGPRPAEPRQPLGRTCARCATTSASRSCSPPTTSTRPTRLADRLLVIDHGTIVADDTADNLKAGVSGDVISLQVRGRPRRRPAGRRARRIECRANVVEGDRLVLTVDARRHRRAAAAAGARPRPPAAGVGAGAPADARRRVPDPDRALAARDPPRPDLLTKRSDDAHRDDRGVPTADAHAAAQPGVGHLRPDPAGPLPRPVRPAARRTSAAAGCRRRERVEGVRAGPAAPAGHLRRRVRRLRHHPGAARGRHRTPAGHAGPPRSR